MAKKNFIIIPLALCIFFIFFSPVSANQDDTIWEKQKESLNLESVEIYWREITSEVDGYLPKMEFQDILMLMWDKDESKIDTAGIFKGLTRYFIGEVTANLSLMGRLVILAVIAALLKNLQTAFSSERLVSISQALVFIVLLSLALQSFSLASRTGKDAIDRMVDFTMALVPLLLTLLASLGSLASAAIFKPVIIFSANFFSLLIKDLVFPFIYFATILMLLDHFSMNFKISRLGQLFKDAAIFVMGFSLTVFGGVLAVSGIAGGVSDGVTLRTAKFLTGAFVPIIGGIIADAVDAVVGASLLLKNGLVLTGVFLLFLTAVFPLLKITSIIFIYKLSSALIQPLGDSSLCDCLNTMSSCLILIFAAVTAVALIFFIVIIMIMGAGNVAVMLRP